MSGSPLFAVAKVSQLPADSTVKTPAAPGTPFKYLQWVTLAAQPDGEQVLLSAEGEYDGPENAQKVAAALEFLRAMLSGGLANPDARGITPETAAAANRILEAAKISNEASRVRLLLVVTPEIVGALGSSIPAIPRPR